MTRAALLAVDQRQRRFIVIADFETTCGSRGGESTGVFARRPFQRPDTFPPRPRQVHNVRRLYQRHRAGPEA